MRGRTESFELKERENVEWTAEETRSATWQHVPGHRRNGMLFKETI